MRDKVRNVIVLIWKKGSVLSASSPIKVLGKLIQHRHILSMWSLMFVMLLLLVFSVGELSNNQRQTILSPSQYTQEHYTFLTSVVLCVLLGFSLWDIYKNKRHKKPVHFINMLGTKGAIIMFVMYLIMLFGVGANSDMETGNIVTSVLGIISIVGVCILLTWAYSRKRKNNAKTRKQLIDTFCSTEKLLKKLGWSSVTFPIKCSGGQRVVSTTIRSLKTYVKEYLFGSQLISGPSTGTGATTIVDSNGVVYQTYRITMQELGYIDPHIATMEFEGITTTDEKHTFDDIKQSVLDEIAITPDSVYSGLEEKIQSTTSMDELDAILAQGES